MFISPKIDLVFILCLLSRAGELKQRVIGMTCFCVSQHWPLAMPGEAQEEYVGGNLEI